MSIRSERILRKVDLIGDPENPDLLPMVRMSRPQLERMIREGRFPAPFHIGRMAMWKESVVQRWISEQGTPNASR